MKKKISSGQELKKIIISLLVVMVVVTACNSNDSKLTVGQKFIKDKQKEIGISCDDLYDNALNFVNLKISKLIETGRAVENWVALFYKDLQRTV